MSSPQFQLPPGTTLPTAYKFPKNFKFPPGILPPGYQMPKSRRLPHRITKHFPLGFNFPSEGLPTFRRKHHSLVTSSSSSSSLSKKPNYSKCLYQIVFGTLKYRYIFQFLQADYHPPHYLIKVRQHSNCHMAINCQLTTDSQRISNSQRACCQTIIRFQRIEDFPLSLSNVSHEDSISRLRVYLPSERSTQV